MTSLIARLDKDHGYKQVTVTFDKKGKPVEVKNATNYFVKFSLNGKRTTEPAGSELSKALEAFRKRQALESGSVQLFEEFREHTSTPTKPGEPGRISVGFAVTSYLDSIRDDYDKAKLAKSSYVSYKKAVEDFASFCHQRGLEYLDELNEKSMLDHETWLYKTLDRRQGEPIYTVASRFRYLNTFLGINGIKLHKDKIVKRNDPGLMAFNKFPRAPKRSERTPYDSEEIAVMLTTAKAMIEKPQPEFQKKAYAETALDLLHFALKTGFRDGEMQHAEWDDIDWKRKTITTGPKPKYGWTTKNDRSRTVSIPSLIDRLRKRKENQQPESELIFPNTVKRPDANLIWYLQQVVERMTAKGGKVKGRIGLHRLRYTSADSLAAHLGIEDLRDFLGHHSITITETYLRSNKDRQRKASEIAFEGIGD